MQYLDKDLCTHTHRRLMKLERSPAPADTGTGRPAAENPYITGLLRNENGTDRTRDSVGDSQIQSAGRERPRRRAHPTGFRLQKRLGKTNPSGRGGQPGGWGWGRGYPQGDERDRVGGEWRVLYPERSSGYTGVHMCRGSVICTCTVVSRMKITHQESDLKMLHAEFLSAASETGWPSFSL